MFTRHASISTTSEHYMHADQGELIAGMRPAEGRWAQRVTSEKARPLRDI